MQTVNSKFILKSLKKRFKDLDIKLIKEDNFDKIITTPISGSQMYFYPEKIINFQKLYGVKPFENEQEYINFLISEILTFYANCDS